MQSNIINSLFNNISNLKSHKNFNKIKVSKNLYEYMKENITYGNKIFKEDNIPILSIFGIKVVIDNELNNMEWEVE